MNFLLQYVDTFTVGVGIISVLVILYVILKRSNDRTNSKSPPLAGGAWPVIGHLGLLSGPELPHLALSALADRYGPIFKIRIGVYPAMVVSSYELAKELFTTYDVAVSNRPKLTGAKLLGYDYANFGFSPYGEYWREMRKITASELLSARRLELLKHVRTLEVERSRKGLYKKWRESANEAGGLLNVQMKKFFGDINMNVILRMVAGKSATDDDNEARRIQKAMRGFFDLSGVFVLRDAIPVLGWLDFGGYEKAMKRIAKEFDAIVGEWLEEHKRKREAHCGDDNDNKDQDFMDVLLSVLDGIDLSGFDQDTVSKATAMTIIAGGTDTTTVTTVWGLSVLLNNPIVLRKVQEEMDAHVGRERLLAESDIDKLVYLQAVVKEILRLYPAGPLSGPREFTENCNIGSYLIPAGTRLITNIHKIQRDPRIYPDPDEFKPERFTDENKDLDVKGQNFELIPFGAGRRACPGIAFGIKMTQLLLASFLQAFEVSTPGNEPVDMTATPGLTSQKATPLQVLVKPRLPAHLYT